MSAHTLSIKFWTRNLCRLGKLPLLALALCSLQAASFSHLRHAALKLDCAYCHTTGKTGERADFPEAATCMICHEQIATDNPAIRALAALPKTEKILPERSMYMLADFVFFSHAKHRAANIACQKCHGNVWQQEAIQPVLSMTMKACITCHRTTHAKTSCTTCHELNQ